MSIRKHRRLLVLLMVAVGVWSLVFFGPTGVRQMRWMADSRDSLPTVQRSLDAETRFSDVYAGVSTGGQVLVHGRVRSEQDLRDLRALLASIAFPHGVTCRVFVQ